jgi:uncharacterized protein YrrD
MQNKNKTLVVNMYYSRQIRDLVVRLYEKPQVKGRIKDIIIDWPKGEIKGFWLEGMGLWKNPHFLSFNDILWINQNNVLIKTTENLKKTKNIDKNQLVSLWYGTPIYNTEGYDCGTLSDILWSYPEGIIQGFAVSQGIFKDFQKGWYFLPKNAVDNKNVNKDGLVLNDNFPCFYEVIRLTENNEQLKQ